MTLRLDPNPLNPAKREISLIPIHRHLSTKTGARIFHPYEQLFLMAKQQWVSAVLKELNRDFTWFTQKLTAP